MYKRTFVLAGLLLVLCVSNAGAQTLTRSEKWGKPVERNYLHNLYSICETVFRSEQPDSLAFSELSTMGVKSILNLRDKHSDSKLVGGLPLNLYNVNMKASDFSDKEIVESLQILHKSPKPVLVHCKHGSDRTGVVIAMYRIVFQNWTKKEAIDEMINGNYGFHQKYTNIPLYIEQVNVEKIRQLVFSTN
ncbi:tyrosine-protein phosphatase [Solitalea canadensis]|nr:tyrosine-protein phosphatase [Solitalea canadensis]